MSPTAGLDGRASVWTGAGFALDVVDLPDLGPGEVLVEVELATICGSDVHTVSGDRPGPVPSVLGHEAVGRVVGVGADAPAEPGQRVVWSIGTACGRCRRCRRGLEQKCERLRKYGHEQQTAGWRLTGAFATHTHLLAGTAVVPVGEDLPAALLAPAGCATATVVCAARRVDLGADDALVVIGCGMLGLTAVAYAADLGAAVLACDPDPARLDLAGSLGAVATVTPAELADRARSHGADVVLEVSGHPDGVASALDVVDLGGRVALVGSVSPGPPVPLDPERVVRGLHSLVGSHNYAPRDLVDAVAFLSRTTHASGLAALVSDPFALADVERAFGQARRGVRPRVALRSE